MINTLEWKTVYALKKSYKKYYYLIYKSLNAQLIGYIAAILTTLSFFPQAIRTIKTKDTSGLSLLMYGLFTIGILFWLIYGIQLGELPIILANAVTLVLSSIILGMKLRYG
jgi:MtN3 and saliva related transmembrane protein